MAGDGQNRRVLPGLSIDSDYNTTQTESFKLEQSDAVRSVAGGLIILRGRSDNLPQRWWFASTAIPLVAATIGPLSNVLSIAALVTPWRVTLPDNGQLPDGIDDHGVGITDPHWEIILNALSLACGFTGNVFLLLNFTGRVRYIVALPLSIIFWVMSAALLIGITSAMSIYVPPVAPGEIYSQGYWHAVIAAILYSSGSVILSINMIGYFRGHYPQQFHLDENQRTLILQTMMFFFWLAGCSGVFCALEGWTYPDALYYADVSVLTIGFGDIAPTTDAGRGFLFVFEIVGIIFLALVVSSVSRFAAHIGADKIIKTHQMHARESTFGRTVTNERELRERLGLPPRSISTTTARSGKVRNDRRESLNKYGDIEIIGRTVTFHERKQKPPARRPLNRDEKIRAREHANSSQEKRKQRRKKLLLLQEEKDRFDAMRQIQEETKRWKQYWALGMAFLSFGILWGIGALVFMVTEGRILDLTYFEALYFCFVALLTIGYGDISPKSNIGKPFFVVWSLIAVPIVTVLIQEMSRTVLSAVNRGTFTLADWTIMPREGRVRDFLDAHPALRDTIAGFQERRQQRKRIARGFQVQDPDDPTLEIADDAEKGHAEDRADARRPRRGRGLGGVDRVGGVFGTSGTAKTGDDDDELDGEPVTALEKLAVEDTEHDLARQLALSIKAVAQDLQLEPPRRYSYEQWVHFTKLIRFSRRTREQVELIEEEEGLVEWDWIGEDSPMLADMTEAEWVLNRLCESLNRYTRRQTQALKTRCLPPNHKSGVCNEARGDHRDEPISEGESDVPPNGGPSMSSLIKAGGCRSLTEDDDESEDDLKDDLEETAARGLDNPEERDEVDLGDVRIRFAQGSKPREATN